FDSDKDVDISDTDLAVSKEQIKLLLAVVNRETKDPLANAKVTLLWQCDCKKECPAKPCAECCPSERVFVSSTDSTGVVKFNGPAGLYRIATDYGAYSRDTVVRVKSGETEEVKISLTIKDRPQ